MKHHFLNTFVCGQILYFIKTGEYYIIHAHMFLIFIYFYESIEISIQASDLIIFIFNVICEQS